jgi:biotin carboxyl carrier protein
VKLSVQVDGESCTLELDPNGGNAHYVLHGAIEASGTATVAQVMPGVFSVLIGPRSYEVRIASNGEALEAWTGTERHSISISDSRDRPSGARRKGAAGPIELRAQMPGKIVEILTEAGAKVQAGQGLLVVEAMKMQNEMKSPKDGIVAKIYAVQGATVGAGESLLVVE